MARFSIVKLYLALGLGASAAGAAGKVAVMLEPADERIAKLHRSYLKAGKSGPGASALRQQAKELFIAGAARTSGDFYRAAVMLLDSDRLADRLLGHDMALVSGLHGFKPGYRLASRSSYDLITSLGVRQNLEPARGAASSKHQRSSIRPVVAGNSTKSDGEPARSEFNAPLWARAFEGNSANLRELVR